REALSAALAGYGGSVLLVSHDRHLLRTTVDRFWIVADGQVTEFDGDLDDYREWLATRSSASKRQAGDAAAAAPGHNGRRDQAPGADASEPDTARPALDRPAQRRADAGARQGWSPLRRPIEQELRAVEPGMASGQCRVDAVAQHVAAPDAWGDADREEGVRVLAERGDLTKRLNALEEQSV